MVLADFGESRAFGDLSPSSAVTTRNRGTECVKSPEMLLVANARKTTRDTYDRRKREGAGVHMLHAWIFLECLMCHTLWQRISHLHAAGSSLSFTCIPLCTSRCCKRHLEPWVSAVRAGDGAVPVPRP